MAKKYGSLGFLGWGMFINSIFGFLVPVSAHVSDKQILSHRVDRINCVNFYTVGRRVADSCAVYSRFGRRPDCSMYARIIGQMDSAARTVRSSFDALVINLIQFLHNLSRSSRMGALVYAGAQVR